MKNQRAAYQQIWHLMNLCIEKFLDETIQFKHIFAIAKHFFQTKFKQVTSTIDIRIHSAAHRSFYW